METNLSFRPTELQAIWRAVSRQLLPIMAATALAMFLAYFLSRAQPPVYQATARLLASQPVSFAAIGGAVSGTPPLDAETYREAALGNGVLSKAMTSLHLPINPVSLQEFQRGIGVRAQRGESFQSSTITINANSNQPERAATKANAVADALRNWENERVRGNYARYRTSLEVQLKGVVKEIRAVNADQNRALALRSLQGTLLRDLDLVHALELSANGQLNILDSALAPLQPVAPRPLLNAVLTGLFALVLTTFATVLRDNSTRAVHDSEEITELTNLPVLGEFPKQFLKSRDLPSEAGGYLRAQLNSIIVSNPKLIAVTSPNAEEGKSSVAISLARAFARSNKNTLLIDLDMRRPVLASEFGVTAGPDILSLIENPALNLQTFEVSSNLFLIPCPTGVQKNLEPALEKFPVFLKRLVQTQFWDVIVVDTPPILEVSDTLAFAEYMSGVLICVNEGETQRQRLVAAHRVLERVGAKVVGAVMTNMRGAKTLSTFGGKYENRQGLESANFSHSSIQLDSNKSNVR